MTEHNKSEPERIAHPRGIDALDATVAELLVHRRLLANLLTVVIPRL
jgi:hypothetical protein